MSIRHDIDKLRQSGVISADTADRIEDFYSQENENSSNKLFLIFGVLGALLIGLGIILIVAHNWDDYSKWIKLILAFVPVMTGQILCGYALLKKPMNVVWSEASALFLALVLGANIALISQIYNISGDLPSFLLTWMILILPIIYIMQSRMILLLFLLMLTYYASVLGYGHDNDSQPYLYWILLILVLPFYFVLISRYPRQYFTQLFHWAFALSIVIVLGAFYYDKNQIISIGYMSLFAIFYMLGEYLQKNSTKSFNGYIIIGAIGSMITLLIYSFDDSWYTLRSAYKSTEYHFDAADITTTISFSLLAIVLFYFTIRAKSWKRILPIEITFFIYIVIFFIGLTSNVVVVLINLLILSISLIYLRRGVQEDHLGMLNFGLLSLLALLFSRFFDTDISFVTRGMLFILSGIGFFLVNYWVLHNRKEND